MVLNTGPLDLESSALTTRHISTENIERKTSIKFAGVMLNKNIKWNNHVNTIERKLSAFYTEQDSSTTRNHLRLFISHVSTPT